MQAIDNINLASALDTTLSLLAAFCLGGMIGLERQYRQRTAGLRTNVLVAVGAAIFVDMANRLGGHEGAVHVIAYVVSGVGFLGAGVIMREEGNVRGLNTAATLWGSAAVGACAGADLGAPYVAPPLARSHADAISRPPRRLRVALCDTTFTGKAIDPQVAAAVRENVVLRRGFHLTSAGE